MARSPAPADPQDWAPQALGSSVSGPVSCLGVLGRPCQAMWCCWLPPHPTLATSGQRPLLASLSQAPCTQDATPSRSTAFCFFLENFSNSWSRREKRTSDFRSVTAICPRL
ncbi:unnamed protein product [Gulo gulo]|uniref:Uncharacterized protein n=1 Tax=Gulo gulo TaxID=48420 RepID=A0A9X9LPZ0_GULGU|nr:unnamed protein product [Gulo gulo]